MNETTLVSRGRALIRLGVDTGALIPEVPNHFVEFVHFRGIAVVAWRKFGYRGLHAWTGYILHVPAATILRMHLV